MTESSQRNEYTADYYTRRVAGSAASAERITTLLVDLLQPRSVVDVGCGTGTWVRAFKERGVERCLGIDSAHASGQELLIPRDSFRVHDLTQPLDLSGFDLAISLEVAEHLPATAADRFVADLTRAAPAILFGAAVPHQGGAHHVNEQWPQYWMERFSSHRYAAVDCIRPAVWYDADVQPWYAQNTFLFVREDARDRWSRLPTDEPTLLGAIHPEMWVRSATVAPRVRTLMRDLPRAVGEELRRARDRRGG